MDYSAAITQLRGHFTKTKYKTVAQLNVVDEAVSREFCKRVFAYGFALCERSLELQGKVA